MKKITLLAVAFVALSLTSCKKDYACECVKTGPGGTSTETHNTGKMKLGDAQTRCNEGDASNQVLGETYTTECTLKN
ncbi:MAG: hypothetical protein V4677_08235 [Bacteroidota bacterium]